MKKDGKLTPMMKQYFEMKKKLPGILLFFRMGDFYEMFYDDAFIASKELEITLTTRDKKNNIPMCGVPYHSVNNYISRLIKKGYKVAICEQLEDPVPGKIVKRDIVKIITPGTVVDEISIDPGENNFLASFYRGGDGGSISFADVTTGEFYIVEFESENLIENLKIELHHFTPSELIVVGFQREIVEKLKREDSSFERINITQVEDYFFDYEYSLFKIKKYFGEHSIEGFGLSNKRYAILTFGAIISYIEENNPLILKQPITVNFYSPSSFLKLDGETIRNLELVKSVDGSKKRSLLGVIDYTCTNMGSRLLKNWLLRPLFNLDEILKRQECVKELYDSFDLKRELKNSLSEIDDLERLISKIASGTVLPANLISLKNSLKVLPHLRNILLQLRSQRFSEMLRGFEILEDIVKRIEDTISEGEEEIFGNFRIKSGFDPELDSLREISSRGKEFLLELERRERERTGIGNLKVKYNKVFGYYIEVTKSNLNLVPENYIRKQTLVNAERFITPELKEFEEKIETAEMKIEEIEKRIFNDLRNFVIDNSDRILKVSKYIAEIDFYFSLAEAAVKNDYVCPEIVKENVIEIRDGRHPILEKFEENFIPNDFKIGKDCTLIILTGPNMGGKSTYLRQIGLSVIMAQMGGFIPASYGKIGVVDQIFTRVGAGDNISMGKSTFMVEMLETANILNTCTPRSLVLLDEVGRGTSTFDGLSIAWAVAEYLVNKDNHRSKVLFATHYHELTRLEKLYPNVRNFSVSVKEVEGGILFLRKVIRGPANKSYGIEVAKLAGLPGEVVERAKEILKKLEKRKIDLAKYQKKSIEEELDRFEIGRTLFDYKS